MTTWQLPEGINELTGTQALAFEFVRRQLLDLYIDKGFSLVIPPMVEHIESLLLTADSINQKTFKFLDPVSGKMLGVHADITPQIARIDAKRANSGIEKYCYVDTILQTQADDFYATRSPIQTGAELYGSEEIAADVEVIELMLESLKLLSIDPIVLSLGNVAIFNALIDREDLSSAQVSNLRQIFVRRSIPDLAVFLKNNTTVAADQFSELMRLEGDVAVLDKALAVFNDLPEAKSAIEDLIKITQQLDAKNINVVIDLGELKAYEYHTGIVFSAYHQAYSKPLAQGGRYNGLSESFGQSRAATGFSFDLKFLSETQDKL